MELIFKYVYAASENPSRVYSHQSQHSTETFKGALRGQKIRHFSIKKKKSYTVHLPATRQVLFLNIHMYNYFAPLSLTQYNLKIVIL